MSAELADPVHPEPWTSPGPVAQRPPRLLLTLLGDYWWQRTEPLPSAAIVALLAEFGVSDSAARAALSRLTRNGLLVTSKTGRRTFSRLSSRAAEILDDGARRIFSFGAASQPWEDRKSTRLNSSHMSISYAVFCLKKKKKKNNDNYFNKKKKKNKNEE